MKKLICFIIGIFLFGCSNNLMAEQTLMENPKVFSFSTKEIRNTFDLVFKDGIWWVYEYDEEGRIINSYPLDE